MKRQSEKAFREARFNKKIEQAKQIAKEDYEDCMVYLGMRNPSYKRKWIKHKIKDNIIGYALEGTPDKAFVFVDMKTKEVSAVRTDKSVIAKFY